MSQQGHVTEVKPKASLLIRGAIWIAIGALIAAALVCVVWVLVGDQDGLIGRAFLTILLLAGFAGIAILEAGLAPNRPDWLALSSMVTWIIALLVGAVKIWLPEDRSGMGGDSGAERFFFLLLTVGILQLALLHVRLFTPAAKRYVTVLTQVIYYFTIAFLVVLAGMLIFYLALPHTFDYADLYWRIVVALAILVAVGTTLIPLLNTLFAPKKQHAPKSGYAGGGAPQPYAAGAVAAAPQWPTYADGWTPLPALADGSPDWNAYYTGQPSVPAIAAPQTAAAYPQAPAAPVWPAQAPAPAQDAWAQPAAEYAPQPEYVAPQQEYVAPPAPVVPEQQAPVVPEPPQPGAFPPPPPLPPKP